MINITDSVNIININEIDKERERERERVISRKKHK